ILTVAILLIASVLLTGCGARIMVVGEFAISSRRRYYSNSSYTVVTGSQATTTGLVLFLLGVAIIITLSVLWKRGWSASEIQSGLEPYDRWT
ncbi:MAG TPA: hypothetical protein VK171_06850, partial [Fimbriimonas sp.]|nr:hypothetical protein [Fimbriimonas sp.]